MKALKWLENIISKAVKALLSPIVSEFALFLTIVVTFVPQSFINVYRILLLDHTLPVWLVQYVFGSVGIASIASLLTVLIVDSIRKNRLTYCIVKGVIYFLIFVLWFVSLFLINNFNTMYSPQVLTLLIETNRSEATEFAGAWLTSSGTIISFIIWVITLAVTLVLEHWRESFSGWLNRHGRIRMLLTVVLLGILAYGAYAGSKIVKPYHSLYELEIEESVKFSNDVITDLHQSLVMLYFKQKESDRAIELTLSAAHESAGKCHADSLTIVLVIGESYNKHHSSLYGYSLDTSPRMTAERDSGRLIVMNDAVSPYNLTSSCLKDLFSLNSIADCEKWFERPMWTAVMSRYGWSITLWDNQRDFLSGSIFTLSLNSILYDERIVRDVYTSLNDSTFYYDSELIENYKREHTDNPSGQNLVIFHLKGQHVGYNMRYPEEWNQFKASDVPQRGEYLDDYRLETIATYDNATLYNDYVLSKILDIYRDRNAVVIMLSDHGEEVYDYRDFKVRDHNPKKTWQMLYYENQIPMFVWCSDVFANRYPDKFKAISLASNRPFMLDAIGQIVLWLAGIEDAYYIPERNVFSPEYSPKHRMMYDGKVDYDALRQEQNTDK